MSCINEVEMRGPYVSSTESARAWSWAIWWRISPMVSPGPWHRWTGRFEAHLWDKGTWNNIRNKKGKKRAYDSEEAAARTYDLAALNYQWKVFEIDL
ncbi:hypothetical protein LXL04_018179 [Taraxacum kok-saghyz]